jgi:multiple sugar transport system substrate-binding protein
VKGLKNIIKQERKESKMRKSILWLTIIVVSLALTTSLVLSACKTEAETTSADTAEATVAESTAVEATEAESEESAPEEEIVLNMWWWGETEKPGLKDWLDQTISLYKESHPNITIVPLLQNVDNLQTAFRTAAAAKDPVVGPDIQFFWPGAYMMPDVWNGYVEPLNDLMPQEFFDELKVLKEEIYDGKIWGVPWYAIQMPVCYNKTMFKNAGLDPENPPKTWEEFLDACEKLKASGVTPFGVGTKDGWFMAWWLNDYGAQGFDSIGDLQSTFVEGNVDNPGIRAIYEPMHDLWNKGYCNENATSLAHYEGFELLKSEDVAMTICIFPDWIRDMGDEKIGIMRPPIHGTGKMAQTGESTGVSFQTMGITSWSAHKQEAADFIMFMMSKERGEAQYDMSGAICARKDFDTSILKTQMEKSLYNWTQEYPYVGNVECFIPEKIAYEGLYPAAQLIHAENYTVDQCIEYLQNVVTEWKTISPEQVESFTKWSEGLK